MYLFAVIADAASVGPLRPVPPQPFAADEPPDGTTPETPAPRVRPPTVRPDAETEAAYGEAPNPAAPTVLFARIVLKSHPAISTTAAFAALAAIIAQVPAARSVIVFKFFMLSVLSIV